MKIRSGFVSNSSSSSYIVRIEGLNFEEMCYSLAPEYSYSSIFSLDVIKEHIEKQSKWLSEQKEQEQKQGKATDTWLEHYETRLEELKNKFNAIDKDDYSFKQVMELFLYFYDISCSESENAVELNYFTSMHNDFNEGMTDALKEILLYFMFDTKYRVTCERNGD